MKKETVKLRKERERVKKEADGLADGLKGAHPLERKRERGRRERREWKRKRVKRE